MRNALEKLEKEIERLKALYALSESLFYQIYEHIHKSKSMDSSGPFGVKWRNRTVFVAADKNDLSNKLIDQFPRYIREMLFVRMISAGLDVFLLEVVKEIPSVCQDTHVKIEKAGSLKDICKLYKDKLGLDLTTFSDWTKIEQMQKLRNELVHRLGSAKPEYRHRYKLGLPKASVTARNGKHVHPNLLDLTEVILCFAELDFGRFLDALDDRLAIPVTVEDAPFAAMRAPKFRRTLVCTLEFLKPHVVTGGLKNRTPVAVRLFSAFRRFQNGQKSN